MPIPDYFGDRLQGSVNIQAPPLAVPVQQTQGIPADQALTDYSVDQPSMSARSFMQQDPHAQMRENLLNQLPQVQAARQAAVDKMMAPVQSEDEKLYNKFVNDPKIQRLFTGVAWNGNQRRATMLSFLKQIGDRIENGHKETLDAAKEFGDLTGQTITLRGQMANQSKAADNLEARTQSFEERVRHNKAEEEHQRTIEGVQKGYLAIRQQLLPHQQAALDAAILGRDASTAATLAGLPYVAPQAQAKLNLTKTQTSAIPYGQATGRMAATGIQLPGANMPPPGAMVPPPPPDVASGTPILPGGAAAGSINQPVQAPQVKLTPRAQQNQAASQATADLKAEQTKGQKLKNAKANEELASDAEYAASRQIKKNKVDANFWRKNSDLWDNLSDASKHQILQAVSGQMK